MISIEYAHITKKEAIDQEIEKTNAKRWFFDGLKQESPSVEFFIMIDDLHGIDTVDEVSSALTERLNIKPDLILPESAFIPIAEKLLEKIGDNNPVHIITRAEEMFFQKIKDQYKSSGEFQVSYLKGDQIHFSCPMLVAASYAWRLGLVTDLVNDQESPRAEKLIQVLPESFLSVEDNARMILKACGFKDLPIEYYLYV